MRGDSAPEAKPAAHASAVAPEEPTATRRVNLTVALVLALVLYLYGVCVLLVIVPWLSYSVPGVLNASVLTASTGLTLYAYLFCVFLDPGSVPHGWQPDHEAGVTLAEVKRKGGGARFCQKCCQYKPPRAHHCRVCKRCVLRMDHHCPWTNNCIGHANHKAFLHLLFYGSAAITHAVGLLAAHALHALHTALEQRIIRAGLHSKPLELQESGLGSVWLWAGMQVIAFLAGLPLAVGLLMLLGWHIHLTLTNKTTIEFQEGVRAEAQASLGMAYSPESHPYDLGPCNNLHALLGDEPVAWCCPPTRAAPGGTSFPTALDERALGLMG